LLLCVGDSSPSAESVVAKLNLANVATVTSISRLTCAVISSCLRLLAPGNKVHLLID